MLPLFVNLSITFEIIFG